MQGVGALIGKLDDIDKRYPVQYNNIEINIYIDFLFFLYIFI